VNPSAPANPPEPGASARGLAGDEPGRPATGGKGAEASGANGPAGQTTGRAATWVSSTYFAEGLPFAIVHQVSSELFTALGASLQAVGLTAIFGFAWNGKALWSPIIDLFGTTRRWLIGLEIALAVAVAAIAWPAGRGDLKTAAVALAAVAFLAATHDIAVDGYYIRALSKEGQEAFTGLRISAYRVALLVGKGVLVGLAGLTSWRVCFLAAGGILLALALLHAVLLPSEERRASSNRLNFAHAFTTFLAKPQVALIIAFIITFRAGDALMFAMHTPLLKHLGLDTAARALVSGTLGTIGSIAGAMLGSLVISRVGFRRTLVPITCVQSAAILLYVWMAWARPSLVWIGVVVVAEQVVAGIGTAALMSFIMRRATGEYKASHFAIATSLMSVAMTGLGSGSGFLANAVGFVYFFAIAFAASLPGVVLSFWAPKE
jgi:PAT family beta-lactamase induction signal transducer AmpG